jgi:hypothetical protein
MALFTDGNIASIEDLKDYESAVLQAANIEGIDITAKLKLAQREIGFEIASFTARHGFTSAGDLGRVVVSESLLHWHCLQTLELIYRDAYNSQLNDRYLGKWKEYMQASGRAAATAMDLGVGMVSTPVNKAVPPVIATEPGGSIGTRTYFVAVAWQASSGSTGEASEPTMMVVPAGTLLCVNVSSAPAGPSGWYVYAGPSDTELRRQNDLPLAPDSHWLEPVNGLRSDLQNVSTQRPDWYVRNRRVLQRG